MSESKDLKDRILQMRQDNNIDNSKVHNEDIKTIEEKEKIAPKTVNTDNSKKDLNVKKSKEEEAFKLLASKFNQSVEVILELTKRVEKLETLVRLQSMQSDSFKSNKTENLKAKKSKNKLFFITMLLLGGIYLVYFFKIDLKIMHEIISEFSNIIKK
tara:strand:- start:50 stop:520 length:471 start_codon:yes stop_codon:yes gene_type:complete